MLEHRSAAASSARAPPARPRPSRRGSPGPRRAALGRPVVRRQHDAPELLAARCLADDVVVPPERRARRPRTAAPSRRARRRPPRTLPWVGPRSGSGRPGEPDAMEECLDGKLRSNRQLQRPPGLERRFERTFDDRRIACRVLSELRQAGRVYHRAFGARGRAQHVAEPAREAVDRGARSLGLRLPPPPAGQLLVLGVGLLRSLLRIAAGRNSAPSRRAAKRSSTSRSAARSSDPVACRCCATAAAGSNAGSLSAARATR